MTRPCVLSGAGFTGDRPHAVIPAGATTGSALSTGSAAVTAGLIPTTMSAGTPPAAVSAGLTPTTMTPRFAALMIPGTTTPPVISVTISPIMGHSSMPRWNTAIITPSAVIVLRTIPMTIPGSPPPPPPVKHFFLNIGNGINIHAGQHNHIRRRKKWNRRRQRRNRNLYLNIDLCRRQDRKYDQPRQKNGSKE